MRARMPHPRTAPSSITMIRILVVTLVVSTASTQDIPRSSSSELGKLDQLFRIGDHEQYDRRQTPSYWAGTATRVHIQMYIRSFGSINPIQMDYTVDLYLRQRWLELRFLNNSLTRPLDLNDPILVKMLWKPEVYFPNAKDSDFQYVTLPNVMLRIHPDGNILYILRLKLTFSCMMDLASFPLDHQTCYIQLASFVKTTQELELVWYEDSPIKMYKRLTLPQFQLKEIKVDTCTQSFHIGNYSCLQAVFELERNIGYHLVQSYLPTSLIVVVSWVSFWLDVDAIPSRVTLGVTTLLTVCSESTSFRDNMPIVSYVKALDIWMGSCTAFVFLALLEFTVVSHIARHHRRFFIWGLVHGRSLPARHPHTLNSLSPTTVCQCLAHGSTSTHHRRKETPSRLAPGTECQSSAHASTSAGVQAAASQADGHGAALTPRQDVSKHVSKKCTTTVTETRDGVGESSCSSNRGGDGENSSNRGGGGENNSNRGGGGENSTCNRGGGGENSSNRGGGGENSSNRGGDGENSSNRGGGGENSSNRGGDGENSTCNRGGGGENSSNRGSGGENSYNRNNIDDNDSHPNLVQVADHLTGGHAPAGDVNHDARTGGGQQARSGDISSITTSRCYQHHDEGTCVPALSDVALSCLPPRWRQQVLLAKRIDKVCRAVFPALFLLFNLVYWLYYQALT
ncbi:uncharacterized protein [Panulirus ornatus]|uniref:uncharacterized protein isoform X2 n=1 Tax=Panulirus ornatus TaxID=150431 RepID=UPI003A8BE6B7